MYEPGKSASQIAGLEKAVLDLQKSPQGWQLAQGLLDRPAHSPSDDQLKFMGALTIIIKLNTQRQVASHQNHQGRRLTAKQLRVIHRRCQGAPAESPEVAGVVCERRLQAAVHPEAVPCLGHLLHPLLPLVAGLRAPCVAMS